MAQTSAQIRVQGGVPWWLWLLLLVVGGSVLIATVVGLLPDNPEKQFQQGLSAFERGDRDGLLQAVSELRGRPEYLEKVQLLEGLELMATSRPLKAVPLLRSAAESEESEVRVKAQTYLAQSLARGEQRLEAVAVLQTAVGEAPDDPQPRAVLGGILFELGAYTAALEELEKLRSASGREQVMAERLRGEILMDMGQYSEAANEFKAALESDPVNPSNGTLVTKLVDCLMEVEDFEGAAERLEDMEPSPDKEAIRAEIQLRSDKVDDAKQTLKTASAANREGFTGISGAVSKIEAMISAMETPENALKTLQRLRASVPFMSRDAEFYAAMAALARTAEQLEEAELYEQNHRQLLELKAEYQELMKTVISNLDDTAGRIRLGDLASETGNFNQAQTWYAAAAKIDPALAAETGVKMQKYQYGIPELVSTAGFRTSAASTEGENKED